MHGGAASSIGTLPETAFRGAVRERLSRNHRESELGTKTFSPRIARIPRIKQDTKMVENYGESTEISELKKRFLTTKGTKYMKEMITH